MKVALPDVPLACFVGFMCACGVFIAFIWAHGVTQGKCWQDAIQPEKRPERFVVTSPPPPSIQDMIDARGAQQPAGIPPLIGAQYPGPFQWRDGPIAQQQFGDNLAGTFPTAPFQLPGHYTAQTPPEDGSSAT